MYQYKITLKKNKIAEEEVKITVIRFTAQLEKFLMRGFTERLMREDPCLENL